MYCLLFNTCHRITLITEIMSSSRFLFIFVLLSLLISTPQVYAQEKVSLVTGEWPPYTTETMSHYGVFTEIVTKTFEEINRTPEYKFLPWKRCELLVKFDKAWAAFPYAKNKERSKIYDFSEIVLASRSKFFFLKKRKLLDDWNSLQDFKPYSVGGVLGYYYEEIYREAGLKIDYAPTEYANVKKLERGRIDFMSMDERAGWSLIRKTFPADVHRFDTLPKPFTTYPLRMMILKSNPGSKRLLKEFNEGLKRIQDNGTYASILKKHGLN